MCVFPLSVKQISRTLCVGILLVASILQSTAQIRFTKVDVPNNRVIIKNYGGSTVDISSYWFCHSFAYHQVSDGTIVSGSSNLASGAEVELTLSQALTNAGSDVALYTSPSFASSAAMVDFTQWGTAGNGRENVAASKGIWTAGQFVNATSTAIYYGGTGSQNGLTQWSTTPPPVVTSIARQTPTGASTNADQVVFRVTFSGGVKNVDVTDFSLSGTSAGDGSVASVTPISGSVYDVTVTGLTSSNGTVNLDIKGNGGTSGTNNITADPNNLDQNQTTTGAVITRAEFGQSFTASNTGTVTSVTLNVAATSSYSGTATMELRTGDGLSGGILATETINISNTSGDQNFTFTTPGSVTAGNVYTLRFTGPGTFSTTFTVNVGRGNPLSGGVIYIPTAFADGDLTFQLFVSGGGEGSLSSTAPGTDETFTLDNTAPSTTSFTRKTPTAQSTDADVVTFLATFSEDVTGVDQADFAVTGPTGATISISQVSASTYDVQISGGDMANLNATVGLNFAASPSITDNVGNALPNSEPSTDETYTIANNTAPTASNVNFTGTLEVGQQLSGTYTWADVDNGDTESGSTFKWYRSDDNAGTNKTAISGATSQTYTMVAADAGKHISFEVTPNDGTTAGSAVESALQATNYAVAAQNSTGGASNIGVAAVGQSFTAVATGTITSFELAYTGTINSGTYELYAGEGALGTKIASGNITTGAGLGIATLKPIITFPNNVNIIAGSVYTLVFSSISHSGIGYGAGDDPYAGGSLYTNVPPWGAVTAKDLVFKVISRKAPVATNVAFTGNLHVGQLLTGTYTYTDLESDTESGTTYKWYRSDDAAGTNKAAISGATAQTYTLVTADAAKHISFEVTPNDGNSAGAPVESALQGAVPSVSVISIVRQTPTDATTNADQITFRVTFDDGVKNVEATDFSITGTSSADATISSVTQVSSAIYDVLVSGVTSSNGTIDLNLDNGNNIQGPASALIQPSVNETHGATYANQTFKATTSGSIYQLDFFTNSGPHNMTLTFKKSGVTLLTQAITTTAGVAQKQSITLSTPVDVIAGDDYEFRVTNSSGFFFIKIANNDPYADGELTTSQRGSGSGWDTPFNLHIDKAGVANLKSIVPATDEIFTIDNTAPTTTITSNAADPQSGAFTATFTFSEDVTGFVVGDITVGNGAASNFQSTSASVYTATITPAADGAVTMDVAADIATDAAGNNNTVATQLNVTNDETKPTVTITSSADPTSGAFTATFTFSEDVTGFVVGDITVGNGAASNFQSTSASVYTATITPAADGATTVDVAADKAADAAGNNNTAATQLSVTNDETKPTVTITSNAADPQSGAFTANFTFSEDVTGFVLGDISVGNGAASNFTSTNAKIYSVAIVPAADGAVTIDVAADKANDAAGNGNTAGTQLSVTNDETKPTVTITSSTDPTSGVFTATFTFSEDVTSFVVGDITVGNGAASNFQTTSAKVYTATITPTADGATTVDVAADKANDSAGNGNTVATQLSVTNDETKPTVTITSNANNPQSGAFSAIFTFSEDVTGFALEDITVGNGSASTFQTASAKLYTATITPTADGAVTIDVAADKTADAAGNNNTAATQLSVTNDEAKPTVTITSNAADPQSGAFTANFTFSEDVTGFVLGDITVGNGAASNFTATNAKIYSVAIVPAADGAVTIDVAADKADDAAGNGNTAGTQLSVTNDETKPSATITSTSSGQVLGSFDITITFSESVTGFVEGDITLSNGTVKTGTFAGTGTTYTATINGTNQGEVTVDVVADKANDAAGNGNTASTQFSIQNDVISPSVTITSNAANPQSGAFTATFTFTEAVNNFVIGDINVGNGTASNFGTTSTSVYTATITPAADGNVTIDVPLLAATDLAGNLSNAATQLVIVNDETKPTVTITSDATNPQSGAFTATFTFSEDVTGFVVGDIIVGNGAASDFQTTSASVYTATITPAADGAVTMDVAADVAADAATNNNTAATQLSVTNDETKPTVTITSDAANPQSGAFMATFTFSEDVTGFVVGDITVSNGAASNFQTTSASVYTATITPAADGAVTMDVAADVAVDAATNNNTAATQLSVTNDETKPTVTLTSDAANPQSGAFTATFTFSEDVTGFVIGDISVGNGSASNFQSTSASVYTTTITPTADGAVTIDVAADVATDAATNNSTAATQLSVTNDETKPTVTLTASTTSPVNGKFTVTAQFSETVTGFVEADITATDGTTSDFTAVDGDTYTFSVASGGASATVSIAADKAVDAAGNNNTVSNSLALTFDITPPDAPVVDLAGASDSGSSNSDNLTNDNTPTVQGTAEANSTVEVFDGATSVGSTNADGSGNWSMTLASALTEGDHSITAKATDAANNTSVASAVLTISIDVTSPLIPSIDAITDDTGTANFDFVTNDNAVVFSGTAENNGTVELFIDGTSIGTTSANGSGQFSFDYTGTAFVDNSHTLTAKTTDAAGNTSESSTASTLVIDTTAPTAPVVSSITTDSGSDGADEVTNDNTLNFNGTAEANAVVEVFIDGTSIGTTNADGNGDWSFDHTGTTLSDATYAVTAKATDLAGNTSVASSALSVNVDTAAPAAPVVDLAASSDTGESDTDDLTTDDTPTFQGTAEANATVEIFVDAQSFGTTTADGSGNWSHTTTQLPDTNFPVTAKATDAAGNTGVESSALNMEVDLTLNAPVFSPADNSVDILPNTNLVLTFAEDIFKGTGNIVVKKSNDDSVIETIDVTSSNVSISGAVVTIDPTNPILPPATEFYVSIDAGALKDKAGNAYVGISNTTDWSFTIIAAPIVSSVSVPNDGTFKIGDHLDFTVNFNLAVTTTGTPILPFTLGSLSKTAALNGAVTNGTSVSFRYTIIEDDLDTDGIVLGTEITLEGSAIQDQFGTDAVLTLNSVASSSNVLVDGVKPTPVLTSSVTSLTNAPFSVNFEYDEAVSGFELGDIDVTNGTASNFVAITPGKKWSADITPAADGVVSVTLPAGAALDVPGNESKEGNSVSSTFDGTAPEVVSINRKDADQLNTATTSANFRVIFSEDVAGVDLTDFEVVLTGSATGALNTITPVDAKTYDVNVNGISGEGTIGLNAKDDDTIIDAATNALAGTFTGQVYTTNFAPTDISISAESISENNAVGDVIGELSTTDADAADTHSYSLVSGTGDTDNGSFTINGTDLQAAEAFDFETKDSYNIRLKTDDGHGGFFEETFTITIDNVGEADILVSGTANFDPTALGLSVSLPITVENTGEIPIEVRIASATTGFTVNPGSVIIATGASSVINVTFTPTEERLYTGQIVFDYEGGSYSLDVTGEGAIVTAVDDDIIDANEIRLYPNPSDRLLNVDLSQLSSSQVDIAMVNTSGVPVFNKDGFAQKTLVLDVSKYKSGIYIMQFSNGKSVVRKKVMIKR